MTKRRTETSMLQVDGVHAEVTYKPIRSLRMRVLPPDATVKVSVPHGVPAEEVAAFIRKNRQWLARAREQVLRSSPRREPLTDGGRVPLWGRWLEVRLEQGQRAAARLDGSIVVVSGADEEARRRALENLYRREMRAVLPELFATWEPLVGREHRALRLRRMKSRWGSCNTRTASITLNTALAEQAPAALEYVLVHELVHLIERGHGPGFYAAMDRLMPDWKGRRRALRGVRPEAD